MTGENASYKFPETKTCPSKTKAYIRYVSFVWQVTQRNETSELIKWNGEICQHLSEKVKNQTYKKIMENCDPGSSANFPRFSAHFPGSSAHFNSTKVPNNLQLF